MTDGVEEFEDFDASLLCPDVIMEEENEPITTRNESNLPGSPDQTSSPYDFNITGIKDSRVNNSKIHCTACNLHLGSALNSVKNVYVHPLLQVIVCKECFEFYSSGCFERDEDGSEMFCRWCGQGGQVVCCSACPMVFCKFCIRTNMGVARYAEIRDADEWKCFSCDRSQTTALRLQCYMFAKHVRGEFANRTYQKVHEWYSGTDYSLCCMNTPMKKKCRVRDPDYKPDEKANCAVSDKAQKDRNSDDSNEVAKETTPSISQKVVGNEHSYCRPADAPNPVPLEQAAKPRITIKPAESTMPKLQFLRPAVPPPMSSVQFLLKRGSGAQMYPSLAGNPVAAPLVGTPVQTSQPNQNIRHVQRFLLTPQQSPQQKQEIVATKEPNGSAILVIARKVPSVPDESIRKATDCGTAGGKTENNPVQGSRLSLVTNEAQRGSKESIFVFGKKAQPVPSGITALNEQNPAGSAVKIGTISQQTRFEVIPFPTPVQKSSADLDAQRKLNEEAIRGSALANGVFGSALIDLQDAFSKAKYAQDYVTVHNTLQESLSMVLMRLLQAKKELSDGSGVGLSGLYKTIFLERSEFSFSDNENIFKKYQAFLMDRQYSHPKRSSPKSRQDQEKIRFCISGSSTPTQHSQNPSHAGNCCPMGANNCLRLPNMIPVTIKKVLVDKPKNQTNGNP
ncbi:hypothetical protein JTB14_014732 [Gonioctena quinquepunctata]|nr:hypothetical protein JTB14_014732 [Gonioctena quinquepunctata]